MRTEAKMVTRFYYQLIKQLCGNEDGFNILYWVDKRTSLHAQTGINALWIDTAVVWTNFSSSTQSVGQVRYTHISGPYLGWLDCCNMQTNYADPSTLDINDTHLNCFVKQRINKLSKNLQPDLGDWNQKLRGLMYQIMCRLKIKVFCNVKSS